MGKLIKYKNKKRWKPIYLKLDLEKIDNIDIEVESIISRKRKLKPSKEINIDDVKVISSDTITVDLLVFVSINSNKKMEK